MSILSSLNIDFQFVLLNLAGFLVLLFVARGMVFAPIGRVIDERADADREPDERREDAAEHHAHAELAHPLPRLVARREQRAFGDRRAGRDAHRAVLVVRETEIDRARRYAQEPRGRGDGCPRATWRRPREHHAGWLADVARLDARRRGRRRVVLGVLGSRRRRPRRRGERRQRDEGESGAPSRSAAHVTRGPTPSHSKNTASFSRCSGGMYSKLRPRSMISQ